MPVRGIRAHRRVHFVLSAFFLPPLCRRLGCYRFSGVPATPDARRTGRRGEVNAVFGLTANRIPPAGWAGMILWTRDSGGSDGRLVSLFSAATLACAARSLR